MAPPRVQKKSFQRDGILALRTADVWINRVQLIAFNECKATRVVVVKPSEGFTCEDMVSDMFIHLADPCGMEECLRKFDFMFVASHDQSTECAPIKFTNR